MIGFRRAFLLLFSFRGEIGRLAFLLGAGAAYALMLVLGPLGLFAVRSLPDLSGAGRTGAAMVAAGLSVTAVAVICGPFVWSLCALAARRHRALKLSGWTGPATLIVLWTNAARLALMARDGSPPPLNWPNLLFLAWCAALCLWPSATSPRRRAVEAF